MFINTDYVKFWPFWNQGFWNTTKLCIPALYMEGSTFNTGVQLSHLGLIEWFPESVQADLPVLIVLLWISQPSYKQPYAATILTVRRKHVLTNIRGQISFHPRKMNHRTQLYDVRACSTVSIFNHSRHTSHIHSWHVVWSHSGICCHILSQTHSHLVDVYCSTFVRDVLNHLRTIRCVIICAPLHILLGWPDKELWDG
jgi:hypothetical protein